MGGVKRDCRVEIGPMEGAESIGKWLKAPRVKCTPSFSEDNVAGKMAALGIIRDQTPVSPHRQLGRVRYGL